MGAKGFIWLYTMLFAKLAIAMDGFQGWKNPTRAKGFEKRCIIKYNIIRFVCVRVQTGQETLDVTVGLSVVCELYLRCCGAFCIL